MAQAGAHLRSVRHLMQGTFPISSLRPRQNPGCACALRSFSNLSLNHHFGFTTSPSTPKQKLVFQRHFSSSLQLNMSLQKELISQGNGTDKPKAGDTVTMHYTGWLYEQGKEKNRGQEFDSSRNRGEFRTKIGVGQVIKGWDEGVPQMTLGETSVLTIPGQMAYGTSGYPGLIPPNATLIFEVKLLSINGKRA